MEGTHEVGSRPFMPASTLSGRSVALLRVNLDDYTSEGRSISHGNYTRTQVFITKINRLSMEMTHTRRKKNGHKERKRVLREMKRVVTVVRAHAQRYHRLLDENWQATDWTRPQAEQVLKRLEPIIEALPAAVKQAHERIIGERQVANDEKLLSLFEPNIHVIVRGKAGEEVEFGNLLVLGEQIDGLIIDWELFKEEVPADHASLRKPLHYDDF